MRMPLRSLIIAAKLLLISTASQVFADDGYKFVELKQTRDFAAAATQNQRDGHAMLLMFSGEGCRFCVTVEEDFLKPMLRSGDYDKLISMHKVHLTGSQTLTDFDGRTVSARQLADRYGVFVMPTVVFLDARGNEVAPKRVGLMTPAFYGGYLDDSIRTAAAAIQQAGAAQLSAQRP